MTGVTTVLAVTGTAMVGGVYAAFSLMVMPTLTRIEPRAAARTMTDINRAAERGPFVVVFLLTAAAALALAVDAAGRGSTRELVVAGSSLAGAAITVVVNVPLNRRLARRDLAWHDYARRWGAANSVRAAVSLAAVAVASLR